MTTNHPELLDEALTRPGHADMKVEFGYASQAQIRGIFLKMYTRHRPDKPDKYDSETLASMANSFADVIPEFTFSPAELQQHLLIHRAEPETAIERALEMVERKQRSNFKAAMLADPNPYDVLGTSQTFGERQEAYKRGERKKNAGKGRGGRRGGSSW